MDMSLLFSVFLSVGLIQFWYPLTIEKLTGEIQPFCPAIHAANVEVGPFARTVRWPVVWFVRGVEPLKVKVE